MQQDIVGPVCETGDYLAQDRALPPFAAGDLIAVMTAGTYGAVMSSTYNTRPLIPEVLVNGDRYGVVRPRPSYDDLDRPRQVAALARQRELIEGRLSSRVSPLARPGTQSTFPARRCAPAGMTSGGGETAASR